MIVKPIEVKKYKRIVVLTGAGISVASGLPTYRGVGGLWEEGDTARASTSDILETDPEAAWRFYAGLREQISNAVPNSAHQALAKLQKGLEAHQKLTLITQNIDGLHQLAGSTDVVELHGAIFRTRCSNDSCKLAVYADMNWRFDSLPKCTECSSVLRPDIVLFGEMIPAEPDWLSKRALRECDLFLAVGTSGLVSPACDFVRSAKYVGARTILVNLEPMLGPDHAFDEELLGPAEQTLPILLGTA